MDDVNFIVSYAAGELTEDRVVHGFQKLINSGLVWKLQGSYVRTAIALIEDGRCHSASKERGAYVQTKRRVLA